MFLEFESPFWAEGEEVIKIAREEAEPGHWTDCVLGFDEVVNNRRVLVCWIGGWGAEAMERTSDEEVR